MKVNLSGNGVGTPLKTLQLSEPFLANKATAAQNGIVGSMLAVWNNGQRFLKADSLIFQAQPVWRGKVWQPGAALHALNSFAECHKPQLDN